MPDIQKEIAKLRKLKYEELCCYLKNKYGAVNGPYFMNEGCKTKNEKIKRTNEGLFIHHIYESKAIMLSHTEYATHFPFEWQEGKNLVYCNYFEHLLLHVAIVKEYLKTEAKKTRMAVGIGGLINYIIPEIIDYINGYNYVRDYMKKALAVIDGNEILFIDILEDLKNYILYDHEVFSIVRGAIGKNPAHVLTVFKYGKMTKSGRFNDYLFKYDVLKKRIKQIDSSQFLGKVQETLNRPGYDYMFDVRQHGEYYYVGFAYYNSAGSIVSKEYAISSSDQIDFEKLKNTYYRRIDISERIGFLIKKDSILLFKEIKNCKNVNKRYCLTVDGVAIQNYRFTKEQASDLVGQNQ